ncbi:cdk7, partial [Symbiodinium sp. KB8]
MAADWFDIDYSAFAYDRDFEEDLCIDDFSYDFLAPAPGQAHNAWERQQASEAWNAQAHCDPPDSASHQYAAFFAQGKGTADARVSGDIIDPAEAPFAKHNFSLWSGAKRDDRHEHRANPAPQPARKRALQRARRRAIKNGGTWYKDRRISITKGVKQGLDERLSQDWSERHATCFADDFLFQWVLESMQACKVMCTDVSVIYEVFASLGLCINSKKSAFLFKLVGTEAEAWLAKHRVLAPEGVEAKHVLRYDLFRRCDVPIKHTHVYLGIALTYDSYEEASMRHRLRLAAIQKHRLARILQGRASLNWCVKKQRELIMTGATTMAPPVAMDKQVMALFGHVLTPMAGEKALGSKQGSPPQEMDVDSSRKRPRQTRQFPPKGRGKGRGKPKDK